MDRRELGEFLRTRRERLRPADVGLPTGLRRRTPGLRREEVASLAAISTDYYARLEQARGPQPSRPVLSGIARALRLSDVERAHLFRLAGEQPGPAGPSPDVPSGIRHLLDRLDDAAAMVVDVKYEVLAWNPLAAVIFDDLFALPPRERNLARDRFLRPGTGRYPDTWEQFGINLASELRAAAAKYPDDPGLRELIEDLLAGSAEFRELWARHDVIGWRGRTKTLHHPRVGRFQVECEVLLVCDRDQRVILYTAEPGSPGHEALQLLKLLGTVAPAR
ncbi:MULTISPECIES: helix-turn-helix transcriptional regulator [Amycolatopsis]|uniref:helix-turn-helix transcriptional regulator n=1 Tax=Amycolatopsis TaxID=1813 RepID=UPI000B8AE800|nr:MULTISPECIES: helix-turn-helix transcriptional regulator [Amycolatopsis]OXM73799.1 transcriptional regulator [Amycolatopsis sp. KNN50.9b]